jgi:hypothetical protein
LVDFYIIADLSKPVSPRHLQKTDIHLEASNGTRFGFLTVRAVNQRMLDEQSV